jgi:hypothetical protein
VGRYILRYGGVANAPSEHIAHIRGTPGIHVLDQSPKMLLVDAGESEVHAALKGITGWSASVEQSYPLPDTRKKIE